MKKICAKILALIIVLNTLCFCVPVFASAGTIVGSSKIVPPPSGQFSAVKYVLKDLDGNVVSDAKWSVAGTLPNGLYLDEDTGILVINGDTVQAGDFGISVTHPTVTAPALPVTVLDLRFFSDFNDSVSSGATRAHIKANTISGGNSSATWNGSTDVSFAEKASDSGDYYANGDVATYYRYWYDQGSDDFDVSQITFDYDFKVPSGYTSTARILFSDESYSRPSYRISTDGHFQGRGDGSNWAYDYGEITDGQIGEWKNIKISMDFYSMTSQAIVSDGFLKSGNGSDIKFPLASKASPEYKIWVLRGAWDNISVYSGIPAFPEIKANIPAKVFCGTEQVKIPLDGYVLVDGERLPVDLTYNINNSNVEIENDFLIINPGASGTTTVTADWMGKTKDFTFDIVSATEETGSLTSDAKSFDAELFSGYSLIKANVKGENAKITGLGSDISLGCNDTEESEITLYIDGFDKEYKCVVDNIVKSEGSFGSITAVSLADCESVIVYAGSQVDETPRALNVRLSSTPVLGGTISAEYDFYSPLGYTEDKTNTSYKWYVDGSEKGTNKSFTIDDTALNKEIYVEVTPAGGGLTGTTVASGKSTVIDLFTYTFTAPTASLNINNTTGGQIDLKIFGVWFNGTTQVGITAKDVSSSGQVITETLDAPTASTVTDVRIMILDDNYNPLAPAKGKTAGYTASGESQNTLAVEDYKLKYCDKRDSLATLMVFNPVSDGEFINKPVTDLTINSATTDLSDKLLYIDICKPDISFAPTYVENGLHIAKIYAPNTIGVECNMINGVESVFGTSGVLANTAVENDFNTIIKNCTGEDVEAGTYAMYRAADKEIMKNLIAAEGYDLTFLELAAYCTRSIKEDSFLKTSANLEAFKTLLAEKNISSKGAELLAQNTDFDAAALIDTSGTIENTMKSMKEQAILNGVAKSGNYLETKVYLSEVDGYTVTDAMATAFTKQSYATYAALCSAMSTFVPPVGNSGNSYTSSGGSSGFGGGSKVTISNSTPVNQPKNKFSDLNANHWAYSSILRLTDKNILSGYGDGTFAAENNIKRSEYAKILYLAFALKSDDHSNRFADISENDWFYDYVTALASLEIINGDGTGFKPNNLITREDAAVMIYRVLSYFGNELEDESEIEIPDIESVSDYAKDAVRLLYANGIINGMPDGTFAPKAPITRAQAAAIIDRIIH